MSAIGYNGDALIVKLGSTVIAAISTKSVGMARSPVEVPTDDSNGWMVILPRPGRREVNTSIEGVVTSENVEILTDEWEGNTLSTIEIELPDGRTMTAAEGFFLGDLEFSGEEAAHVAFTGSLRSSGKVTIAASGT